MFPHSEIPPVSQPSGFLNAINNEKKRQVNVHVVDQSSLTGLKSDLKRARSSSTFILLSLFMVTNVFFLQL